MITIKKPLGIIGKKAITASGYTVLILDKIITAIPVYKYSNQHEANRHGYNYGDGATKLGEQSVTKYLCKVITDNHNRTTPGSILIILPEDIRKIQ